MYSSAWVFPVLIVFGGICTYIKEIRDGKPVAEAPGKEGIESLGVPKAVGAFLILTWLAILILTIILRSTMEYEGSARGLFWFESFYRTGSIIFGGGQVVLPLIINELVQYKESCVTDIKGKEICETVPDYEFWGRFDHPEVNSWMTEAEFLAGLGLAQAMPGPLFNISAYLGALAASKAGVNALVGVACAWFGLFGPGVLVIYGALPFWGTFRKWPVYRRALPGMNSAAVGLIVASVFSLYNKVRSTSPFPDTAVAIGLIGFVLVELYKAPAPAVVVLGGILGLLGTALKLKWVDG
mmetsp:Transcript_26557/g.41569  ORF Transcript_26557/g.41569 Transcript_26557/m.41569 type:complete len:297 (+) Transcript_26557:102-992(+)